MPIFKLYKNCQQCDARMARHLGYKCESCEAISNDTAQSILKESLMKYTQQMIDHDAITTVLHDHLNKLHHAENALRELNNHYCHYTVWPAIDGGEFLLDEDDDLVTHPTTIKNFSDWVENKAKAKSVVYNLREIIVPALTALQDKAQSEFNDETKAVIAVLEEEGRREAAESASDQQERIFCGGY